MFLITENPYYILDQHLKKINVLANKDVTISLILVSNNENFKFTLNFDRYYILKSSKNTEQIYHHRVDLYKYFDSLNAYIRSIFLETSSNREVLYNISLDSSSNIFEQNMKLKYKFDSKNSTAYPSNMTIQEYKSLRPGSIIPGTPSIKIIYKRGGLFESIEDGRFENDLLKVFQTDKKSLPLSITSISESKISDDNIIFHIGTLDGKIYRACYGRKNKRITNIMLLHQFNDLKRISQSSIGSKFVWSTYESKYVTFHDLDKLSVQPRYFSNFMDLPLPTNSSIMHNDNEIIVITSMYCSEYAFMLNVNDDVDSKIVGIMNISDDCDVYCEIIKRYNGPKTNFFKTGNYYCQFRTWDKEIGFIHELSLSTNPKNSLTLSKKPIIFDFVPFDSKMIYISSDGFLILYEIILKIEKVLYKFNLSDDNFPDIMCDNNMIFIGIDGIKSYKYSFHTSSIQLLPLNSHATRLPNSDIEIITFYV